MLSLLIGASVYTLTASDAVRDDNVTTATATTDGGGSNTSPLVPLISTSTTLPPTTTTTTVANTTAEIVTTFTTSPHSVLCVPCQPGSYKPKDPLRGKFASLTFETALSSTKNVWQTSFSRIV